MKRCPQCNADYFDNMLEYCLEDGAKLFTATEPNIATSTREQPTAFKPVGPLASTTSEPTVVIRKTEDAATEPEKSAPHERTSQGVAMVPMVIALAHNWWQWVYLEKQYVYSITDYLLSANFILWLILLAGGVLSGLYAFKHSKNKTFALTGLVILAINLILFLVPRR